MNQVCNLGGGEFETKIMHFIKIFKIIKITSEKYCNHVKY